LSASLSQAKILGGTGWILLVLSIIPRIGFILGIIGFALVLFATKQISDTISDRSVFRNMIISTVLGIAALIAVAIVVLIALNRIVNYMRSVSTGVGAHPHLGVIVLVVVGLLVVWLLYLLSAFFLRRSFNTVAQRLNVGLFRTAGLVFLIGAALTIILVGFLILLVAEIIFAIAFFTIPEQPGAGSLSAMGSDMIPPSPPGYRPTSEAPSTAPRSGVCSRCGANISEGTVFCPSCGQKQV